MLKQDTDEQHPLTTNQIIEKLKAAGIECDRKTLYQDIATLNSYGYEIIQRRGQHNNSYYVIDRNFDVPELRILMDAVQAASFVTEKKTAEFIDKISALGGSNRAELLKRNIVLFNTTKHTNENIYYSIDKIDEAILSERKIAVWTVARTLTPSITISRIRKSLRKFKSLPSKKILILKSCKAKLPSTNLRVLSIPAT